ncbi:MAG: alanine--glyoxylate aminotransferase family protein [Planctomycetes bacterium]|nr:alanine--glyoxylate aminotransferase family protein [Planctomycetota bacterium]
MKKTYLFTPGPTMVPPEVALAEAQPMIHHRTPEFSKIFVEVTEGLKYLFQTKTCNVYTLASSGTGGMEACVVNILSKGDKALVIRGGKFGERWAEICEVFGVKVIPVDVEYGKAVEPELITPLLRQHRDVKAVFTTQSETSTGVICDISAIARIVKEESAALMIVDAISSICVHPLLMDDWGIDLAVTGSQKGFLLPPGLAFVCVNQNAMKAAEKSDLPKYYWSFKKMQKNLKDATTPFTPAVSLIRGLKVAIDMIKEEGIENVWQRHARLAHATREAVKALGLELFAGEYSSNVLTAVRSPNGLDTSAFLKKLRDKYGVSLAGGQDELKGKIFRIGHMGYVNDFDVITAISSVEKGLSDCEYPVEIGKGIARAQEILLGEEEKVAVNTL